MHRQKHQFLVVITYLMVIKGGIYSNVLKEMCLVFVHDYYQGEISQDILMWKKMIKYTFKNIIFVAIYFNLFSVQIFEPLI